MGQISQSQLLQAPLEVALKISKFLRFRILVCPVDAIFSEDELPEDQQEYLALNAELCEIWPVITEQKDPLPDSDDWREVKNKREHLER